MNNTAEQLLDSNGVASLLKVNRKHVERLRAENLLPQPIELGPRTIRWRAADIDQWIADGCPSQDGPSQPKAEASK